MSYLAIARKYRPATFDEIVGQEHVTRTIKNAIARDRIHHAFLFSGARGVGKTTAARALARALNCQQGPTATPCGVCTSCVEITQGNSPDLIEIDGASNNSVDDIRDLRETVRYAPTRGKFKIYLIDEVHMLSKGAFNALLKTLEEPPPHVVFIFATTESNKIPETILSRVQRFDFKRIPATGVAQRLKEIAAAEKVELTDGALKLIARAGEGSMRDAQSLLDQVISYAATPGQPIRDDQVVEALGLVDRGLLYDMLQGLVAGEPDRCLAVVERVYGYGYELSEFTGEMLEVLRNAAFVRLSPQSRKYVDVAAEELDRLDEIAKDVDPEVLVRAFSAMLDVHDQVSKATRPRVVLEMAVARLATTRPVQPVGQLLNRLDDLEKRLRTGGGQAPVGGMRSARTSRPAKLRGDEPADDEGAPAAAKPSSWGPAASQAQPAKDSWGPAASPAPASPKPSPKPKSGPAAPPDDDVPWPADESAYGAPSERPPVEPPRPPSAAKPRPQSNEPAPKPAERPRVSGWTMQVPEPEPAAAPAPAKAEPSGDPRWALFQAAVRDAKLAAWAEGIPETRGETLRMLFSAPRALAEARRTQRLPELDRILRDCYPGCTAIEPVGREEGPASDALAREIRQDPSVRRIVEKLGAEIGRVIPLTTELKTEN